MIIEHNCKEMPFNKNKLWIEIRPGYRATIEHRGRDFGQSLNGIKTCPWCLKSVQEIKEEERAKSEKTNN